MVVGGQGPACRIVLGGESMKKIRRYKIGGKVVEREVNYIPLRYIFAILMTVAEVLVIIGAVAILFYALPYAYVGIYAVEIFCVLKIVASDDNPDYKVPWLLFVLILPVVGFMLYFLFYSRKLKRKFVRRLKVLYAHRYQREDGDAFAALQAEAPEIALDARMLCRIGRTHLYQGTKQQYFPLGEDMHRQMLLDLQNAKKFIFLEYFIIEEGTFWHSILDILKEKAQGGVDVRVIYDDIGCMTTLPGNYAGVLRATGIAAVPFSRLRGNADNEFNNRSHRKILVIDGAIGYTGGVNLADEYINKKKRFGHWKDSGLRLEGEAVHELTQLFLTDYSINAKDILPPCEDHFPVCRQDAVGYVIPFGDGPRPLYDRRVSKSTIQNMLARAVQRAWITTPYLIIDNDLCTTLESTAMRGVDVRIILPHLPDKKIVFAMTRSFYPRLMAAGVKLYEYAPGFMHAKSYLIDNDLAMIGSVNLDYRSLVHHFENGVWLYRAACIQDLAKDLERTLEQCIPVDEALIKVTPLQRIFRAFIRIFAPLM